MRQHVQILRLAEEMGLIEAAADADEPPAQRLARLVREGRLSERTVHDLERDLATPAVLVEDEDADQPVSPDPERYQLGVELGAGGMGRVFKARDLRLGRFVALKLLHRRDPDSVRRFLREARTQARVNHAAVCKIYEVGPDPARPYISMQLVEGETLVTAARAMELRERVAVAIEIAGGIHAAHRLGLIHRDLKPGNVLIQRDEDGRRHAFVTDFGLAVELEAGGVQTQAIVGTPCYMSPEQARGLGTIDHRSDVYSLGATLFSILTGRPPFQGATADVLAAVIAGPPPPLRRVDPSLPRDLETIVAYCVASDPARRYGSARAVAEDLARFLDGEPILARAPSLFYRARRWAANRRALVAVTAVAAVGLLAAGAVALRERRTAGERALLAQRFGQEVEQIEHVLRAGYTLPLHDARREKAQVRARMERLRVEMGDLGDLAAAPGRYALGRGALALGDLRAARRYLEEAWGLGLRTPEVAYALGHTLALLYGEGLERAEQLRPEAARERRRRELAETLRAPAIEHLARIIHGPTEYDRRVASSRRSEEGASSLAVTDERRTDAQQIGGQTTEAHELSGLARGAAGSPAYVEGQVAFVEGRLDEAVTRARQAFAADPTLYEAPALAGRALVVRARDLSRAGRHDEAGRDLEQAGADLAVALDIGRSDPTLHEAECSRLMTAMNLVDVQGGDLVAAAVRARAACERALVADADRVQPLRYLAEIASATAAWNARHGASMRPAVDEAIAQAARALARDPDDVEALLLSGQARRRLADAAFFVGEDPEAPLTAAVADLTRADRLTPGLTSAQLEIGEAWRLLAEFKMRRGKDARDELGRAQAGLRRAIAIDPTSTRAIHALANALALTGELDYKAQRPWRPAMAEAVGLMTAVRARNPTAWDFCQGLGLVYLRAGSFEDDPTEARRLLELALAVLGEATRLNPTEAQPWRDLAQTHLALARKLQERGEDPSAVLTAGLAPAARAALLNGRDPGARVVPCILLRERAEAELDRGVDPTATVAGARAACEEALRVSPSYLGAVPIRVDADALAARWAVEHGGDPTAILDAAAAAVEGALAMRVEPDLLTARAIVQLWRAQHALRRGRAAAGAIARGLADIDRALALMGRDGAMKNAGRVARARAAGGELHLAEARVAPEAQRAAAVAAARADLEEAIALRPVLRRKYAAALARLP